MSWAWQEGDLQEGHEDVGEEEEGVYWTGDEECGGAGACAEKDEGGR